jgi:fused signal recognition particle receptor
MTAFTERLKSFFGFGKTLSDDVFEDLTDLLVEGDFGAAEAYKISDKLKEACKKEKINDGEGAKKNPCKAAGRYFEKGRRSRFAAARQ